MAKVITTELQHSGASSANITLASDGSVTLPADTVDIATLSATGTASSSTYLRGDNSWATPTDNGKIIQVVELKDTGESTYTSTSYADYKSLAITPASGSKVLVSIVVKYFCLGEASIGYGNQANFGLKIMRSNDGFSSNSTDLYTSPTDSGGKYAAQLSGHDGSVTLTIGGTWADQFVDDSPGGDGSTAITYKIQAAKGHSDMGNLYLGRAEGSSIILMEIGS